MQVMATSGAQMSWLLDRPGIQWRKGSSNNNLTSKGLSTNNMHIWLASFGRAALLQIAGAAKHGRAKQPRHG